jgi:hypothetical protein
MTVSINGFLGTISTIIVLMYWKTKTQKDLVDKHYNGSWKKYLLTFLPFK